MLTIDKYRIVSGVVTIVTVKTDHYNWKSRNVLKVVGGNAGDYITPLAFDQNAIVAQVFSTLLNATLVIQDTANNEALQLEVWSPQQFAQQKEWVHVDQVLSKESPVKVNRS